VRLRRRLEPVARACSVHAHTKEMLMSDTYTGEAYCVKCKAKREFTGAIELSVKGNRTTRLAKGTCPACGTKMTRILPKG
jgi:hypothetical protein